LPIALIISLKKKFQVSGKFLHILGVVLIGSVLFVVFAELFTSPVMMMVSTGAFVLLTMATATLTSLKLILKRLIP
jgi:hypothetical protein